MARWLHQTSGVNPGRYQDRRDAGRELAQVLEALAAHDPIVVALPRGGVPVAYEVARVLRAPLEVLDVRKIVATPAAPALAVAAVAEGGETAFDVDRIAALGLAPKAFVEAVRAKSRVVGRRARRWRQGRAPAIVRGRRVIVVDDGVATGLTARAALRALRRQGARSLLLAIPVGDSRAVADLADDADSVVCMRAIGELDTVDAWYGEFTRPSDAEIVALLGDQRKRCPARRSPLPELGTDG